MSYSHFIKKNFYISLFFFLSCGDNDFTKQVLFKDIYIRFKNEKLFYPQDRAEAVSLHSQFLQSCQNDGEFWKFINEKVKKEDIEFCLDLQNYVKTVFDQKACCYTPSINGHAVKNVYQICIVPGFFIRTIDTYTPKIAQETVDFLKEKDPNCVIKSDIISRWDGYIKDHDDNTDFDTQCEAMSQQINEKTKVLSETYPNAKVHLIFACESFGGKITLFFLNKYLKELQSNRITVDRFITVHSPLYGMALAKYLIEYKDDIMELYTNPAFMFLLSAIQFDFLNVLNVNHYINTFNLLGEDKIDDITTDQALQNLIDNNIQILNFIGTPNHICIGGQEFSYDKVLNLLNIVKGWFWDRDESGEEVFMEEKWDTYDNTLTSLSEIIYQFKDLIGNQNLSSEMVENKSRQLTLNNILEKENIDDVKQVLLNEISSVFDKNMFDDMGTSEALMGIAALLKDLSDFFTSNIEDSDVVVKVNEITKNPLLLDSIKNSRDKTTIYRISTSKQDQQQTSQQNFGEIDITKLTQLIEKNRYKNTLYDNQGQYFIISPNISHAFEHGRLSQFSDDLKTFFIPYLEITTNT